MVARSKATTSLIAVSTLLLSIPISAAPTRTHHCRCTIVDANQYPTSFRSTSLSSTAATLCSNLESELASFRYSKPDLYETWVKQRSSSIENAAAAISDDESSISARTLQSVAAHSGFDKPDGGAPSAPSQRPRERIICQAELEDPSTYEDSLRTLCALHVIIGFAVLACLAEAIYIIPRWLRHRTNQKPRLRLSGTERFLRAHPDAQTTFSPGVEKKLRAYEAPEWAPPRRSPEKREFAAFEDGDDEDDEFNRPVM
ncbi:hypothetical protein BDV95DRAFT_610454 [Massariosphaeria phaeospora]|uniref:Uncharacterized protein n=1 Tax=Massariosphaeria phaeospora TaxID=100035 RepID=A0A7C8M496_9PLEO|nr:hypothetical protein BDV95DRAFT_610454 [Massariosphaeria phaeospora]